MTMRIPASHCNAHAANDAAPAGMLPPFVRTLVSRLPAFPPSVACALTLSLVAPRVLGADALATLDGKAIRIVVVDAGVEVAFRIRSPRFEPLPANRTVDVTFTACAADFLRLATRRADPDTLFFERRLRIEGDTETGLQLKNLLDAVDVPAWITGRGNG